MVKTYVLETPKKKIGKSLLKTPPTRRPSLGESAHHTSEEAAQGLRRWAVLSEDPWGPFGAERVGRWEGRPTGKQCSRCAPCPGEFLLSSVPERSTGTNDDKYRKDAIHTDNSKQTSNACWDLDAACRGTCRPRTAGSQLCRPATRTDWAQGNNETKPCCELASSGRDRGSTTRAKVSELTRRSKVAGK